MGKSDVLSTINTRQTPQSKPAKAGQVKNSAGGYVFKAGDPERLRRFLILGTDASTFYTSAKDLTQDNAQVLFRMIEHEPAETLRIVVDVSTSGRAPQAKFAIFALAALAGLGDAETKASALGVLSQVCRTGTHLYLFNKYVEQFRGRGRGLNSAIARWYVDRPVGKLAYQLAKYRAREDWSHRDVLRKVRPRNVSDPARRVAINWAVGKGLNDYDSRVDTRGWKPGDPPVVARPKLDRVDLSGSFTDLAVIADFEDAMKATTAAEWIRIINRGNGISWEMLPDAAMNVPEVWEALISNNNVGVEAMIRQLPRLTNLGLCDGEMGNVIVSKITDAEVLKRARMHPIKVLVAMRTYAQGNNDFGTVWPVVSKIADGLSDAFPLSYGAVEPSGVRILYGVDTSGSMRSGYVRTGEKRKRRGSYGEEWVTLPITPAEAAGALTLVGAATEPNVFTVGFTTGAWRLDISPRRRLDDVLKYLRDQPNGGTDVSMPIRFAILDSLQVDTFVLLTDGETWAGRVHPFQALEMYRQKSGIAAKLVTVAMTPNGYTINNPEDAGSLNVVGFDTSVPQMISDFSAGRV